MNKTIMHINYGEVTFHSFGRKTVDNICRMAAEIGFDGIEFRGRNPIELEQLSFREYVQQIADAKKKYGLSEILFGIGVKGCTDPDKSIREKAVAEAIEKSKIVNDLCGTTLCNTTSDSIVQPIPTVPDDAYEFFGSAAATENHWDLTVEAYQRIAPELERLGVRFAFETHMYLIHDLPAPTKKLVNLIGSPAIGINMDYGNTVYFPERPSVEEAIDIYGDKLFYTHLKNSSPVAGSRIPTSLADGEINHCSYLEKLKDVGFAGPIGIEAPRSGDRIRFVRQDFAYFKAVMEAI